MLVKVLCICGTSNYLNPEKHRHRPKWCTNCRAVIADPVAFIFSVEWIREKIGKANKRRQAKRTRELTIWDWLGK